MRIDIQIPMIAVTKLWSNLTNAHHYCDRNKFRSLEKPLLPQAISCPSFTRRLSKYTWFGLNPDNCQKWISNIFKKIMKLVSNFSSTTTQIKSGWMYHLWNLFDPWWIFKFYGSAYPPTSPANPNEIQV